MEDYKKLCEAFSRGLPKDATEEQKRLFTYCCLVTYGKRKWKRDTLEEYFVEDFQDFTVDDFSNLPQLLRRDLRDHLRENGVMIPKGRNIKIAEALHRAVLDCCSNYY